MWRNKYKSERDEKKKKKRKEKNYELEEVVWTKHQGDKDDKKRSEGRKRA